MIDTDVDCLIETLDHLINFTYPPKISKSRWLIREMNRVELLYGELTSLRRFLSHSEETRYSVDNVRNLVKKIIDVANEVEYMFDTFVSCFVQNTDTRFTDDDRSLKLDNVMRDIEVIKRDISDFGNHKIEQDVLKEKGSISGVSTSLPKEDKIVGFDDEAREVVDRLVGDQKKLDVISIVGMGGLGKTTMAKRAYYDPYVTYHFYIRGWVTVSQTYRKNNLLFSICSSLSLEDAAEDLTTGKLREVLYKGLKGKRYLIVIDDIWSVEAWNDIRICFPDDNLGSRILVTSRLMNVALHIKPDSPPHLLRFLTVEESWDLLQNKVFAEDSTCPIKLQEIGNQIAERCGGLPLAILVIAGLLAKTKKSVKWWNHVLNGIGSYIVSDPEQYMNTLALSYSHLPPHLKSCFLYVGAFPEDFKISVRKLLWLWIAEGFVETRAEDVAEEYLIDLIERSLVIVDRKRSDGGVKVCRVHDLLHDMCFRIAKEDKFLHEIKPYVGMASYSNTIIRRSFIRSHVPDHVFSEWPSPSTHSFLLFKSDTACDLTEEKVPFLYSAFKHIRVLELGSVSTPFLPSEIGQLVQLRYLSLCTHGVLIPKSISTLWNLQTLLVHNKHLKPINFPFCLDSNMANLMHMRIRPSVRLHNLLKLQNIRTISMLHLSVKRQHVLEGAPNLRKLGCVVSPNQDGLVLFPPLDFLIHLEKLKIIIGNGLLEQIRFTCLNHLPHNLKKVTFLNCYLPWTDLSQLGRLPNLEILKILRGNFQGPRWDTNDGEFQKLKCLKIQSFVLEEWNMNSDHFPRLEKLIMNGCRRLKNIPMCLGDIPTMGLIELRGPSSSAIDSARQILKEQQSLGNDGLKLIIYDLSKDDPRGMLKPFPSMK